MTTIHARISRLRTGEILKVRDGRGETLAVFEGLVWVTQDGDPRDAFIGKGGSLTLDRAGLAVVEAIADSRVAVLATSNGGRGIEAPLAAIVSTPHVAEAERAALHLLYDRDTPSKRKRA